MNGTSSEIKQSETSKDEPSGSSNASSKSLIIGIQDFEKILDKDSAIIDKTLFIKEFIEDSAKVSAILRPRRFGKSLNISMLKCFLSLGQQPSKFNQYLIGKESRFVQEHCGKYPVVMLDLKDCKGENWQEMYDKLWNCILTAYEPHSNDLSESWMCPVDFTSSDAPVKRMENTLSWLITSLRKKHNKRVIVLVDEYDSPLNHGVLASHLRETRILISLPLTPTDIFEFWSHSH